MEGSELYQKFTAIGVVKDDAIQVRWRQKAEVISI